MTFWTLYIFYLIIYIYIKIFILYFIFKYVIMNKIQFLHVFIMQSCLIENRVLKSISLLASNDELY